MPPSLRRIQLLPILILFWALVACSPRVSTLQGSAGGGSVTLQPGHSIGQTFTSRQKGLQAVDLQLEAARPGAGQLIFHLRQSPTAASDLASAHLNLDEIEGLSYYRFDFPIQKDSYQKDYYFTLELTGEGELTVPAGVGGAYMDGALYQDGQPVDKQAVFRLAYDTPAWLSGLLSQVLTWAKWILIGVLAFILPGWALLSWLWKRWPDTNIGEKLGLSAGLSLAIYPVLILWTSLVGLRIGPAYAWLPAGGALAALLYRNVIRPRPISLRAQLAGIGRALRCTPVLLPDLALLAILGLVVVVRCFAIRGLEIPLWGDSYQHTLISQLIVDHGGLFSSWQPYADLQSLTYHFGFHSDVAVFHWLSGLELPQAVLWTGQILNALAVLAIYPLASRLGRSRWSGVIAVLVAGLLAPMPMTYTTWGRYTQLAGQAILPAAIYLSWSALESARAGWRDWIKEGGWIAAGLALGGLALTHYRVLIFAVLFFPAYIVLSGAWRRWRTSLPRLTLVGGLGAVLFMPWFIHIYGGKILAVLALQVATPPSQVSGFTESYNSPGSLLTYLPQLLWIVFGLALAWLFWQRRRDALIFSAWWLLVLFAANPAWFNLPGTGAISNFAVLIAIYIPVGVIAGAAVGGLLSRLEAPGLPGRSAQTFASVALLAGLVLVGLGGARQRVGDLHPEQNSLVTRADLRAAEWIKANTPPEAGFLVNAFFAYGGTSIAGADAGWWLPYLTGRHTNLPPLNYGTEQGPTQGYAFEILQFQSDIEQKGMDDPQLIQSLRDRGLTYLYIGQGQGMVKGTTEPAILQPGSLLQNPNYRLVYHQDRVWLFRLIPS